MVISADDYDRMGVALGGTFETQEYQYRGKTWKAEDIYNTMTAAEQSTEPVAPSYITALIDGKYIVLKRHETSGHYMFFCNAGDLVNNARKIVQVLNASE